MYPPVASTVSWLLLRMRTSMSMNGKLSSARTSSTTHTNSQTIAIGSRGELLCRCLHVHSHSSSRFFWCRLLSSPPATSLFHSSVLRSCSPRAALSCSSFFIPVCNFFSSSSSSSSTASSSSAPASLFSEMPPNVSPVDRVPIASSDSNNSSNSSSNNNSNHNNISNHAKHELLMKFARTPQTPVTIRQLYIFGTKTDATNLVHSAAYLHKELSVRFARQVALLDGLPYGLDSVPSVRSISDLYARGFHELQVLPVPKTPPEAIRVTELLAYILERNQNIVPTMSQGLIELRHKIGGSLEFDPLVLCPSLHDFLDRFYLNRIGLRMLVAHHLGLYYPREYQSSRAVGEGSPEWGYAGVIAARCSPAEVARVAIKQASDVCQQTYGFMPEVTVTGKTDLHFRYVTAHLHYILFELLKNSMRAVAEAELRKMQEQNAAAGRKKSSGASAGAVAADSGGNGGGGGGGGGPISESRPSVEAPISIVIADGEHDIAIKLTDRGGGISRKDIDRIWTYMYTTATPQLPKNYESGEGIGPILHAPMAGFGYGLPLSRLHARYFGGELRIMSMDGHGTDVFLYLNKLGDAQEKFII